MKLKDNENIAVLGTVLGITALISALVLALLSRLTAPAIAEAAKKAESASLYQLGLPEFDNLPVKESIRKKIPGKPEIILMPARKQGKIVGWAVKSASPSGYAGNVEVLTGFDNTGKITAVIVTKHQETPGLGSNVCERKFRKTIFNFFRSAPAGLPPNPVLDQFNFRRPGGKPWKVKRDGGDFDFITGATVTSRAVVSAVDDAGRVLQRMLKSGVDLK